MRLDHLLVTKRLFTTRQKAKEAIKRGHVIVDGKLAVKPSLEVEPSVEVEITETGRPKGYWKLQSIDSEWDLIEEGDVVLDVGSSSGGFVLYASQKAGKVYGIEFSTDFKDELKEIESQQNNITIFVEDAFNFDISRLEPVDLILSDLTLDASSSFKALKRFLPLLREDGKVLFVLKTGIEDNTPQFESQHLKILDKMDSEEKQERYYILSKI